MKSVVHSERVILPPPMEVMMNRATESAKRGKRLVFIKHAVEYGFLITNDPMPRRSFDLIGVALPSGEVAWVEHELKRFGAQCTQNYSKSV